MSVDPRNRYGIRWGRDLPLEEALFGGGANPKTLVRNWYYCRRRDPPRQPRRRPVFVRPNRQRALIE